MAVRLAGVFAVLAIGGVAAGYGVSALETSAPLTISVAAPVPGESPSYPVNEYDVTPDPDTAALAPGVPLAPTRLTAAGYRLVASVPPDWIVGGEPSSRIYSVPGNPRNTYYLRVGILAATKKSTLVEKNARISALQDAEANGAMDHVVLESETDTGFVATYLQGGYRRVTMERFLTLGGTTAYATVAVIGREADRDGMADLLDRVAASLRIP